MVELPEDEPEIVELALNNSKNGEQSDIRLFRCLLGGYSYLLGTMIHFIFHKTYLFDNCEFLVYFETMKSLENLIENNKNKIEKYKCQEYIRFVRIARRMNLRIVTFEKAAQSAKQLSN